MKAGDRILIAPLDWGLGHASRCVPIIRFLLESGMDVIIGGSGDSLSYLNKRFPKQTIIELPSAMMRYGKRGMISIPFMLSMLRFAANIRKEHRVLERIISEYSIDYVFSDNRLGMFSELVPSFYMTHQLNFDSGFLNGFAARIMKRMHLRYINKYRCCFVPDAEGEASLSGILSETDLAIRHLGPLSRFAGKMWAGESSDFDLLFLSGVEPQRTVLENIFIEKYMLMPEHKLHIVRGVSDVSLDIKLPDSITYENNPSDERIANLILSARRVFCRSGYSTLCDLAALGRRAVLVPTPKQVEQEYLAEHFCRRFGFVVYPQSTLADEDFSRISYERIWNYDSVCSLDEIIKCDWASAN